MVKINISHCNIGLISIFSGQTLSNAHCRTVYWIIAAGALVQTFLSLTLLLRSKALYRTIHCSLQKFDEETNS
jgi:hypothetical protein